MANNTVEVELRAENEDLKRKLGEANAKVDEFKGKAETGGETAVKGFKNAVGAVTSFIGKVTAAVGVATLFYQIGQKIQRLFRDIGPEIEASLQKIQFQDTETQLKAIGERLAELQNANQGGLLNDVENLIQGQTTKQVRQEIEILEKTRTFLEGKAQDARNTIDDKKLKDFQDGLKLLESTAPVNLFDGATSSDFKEAGEMLAFELSQAVKRSEFRKELIDAANAAAETFRKGIQKAIDDLNRANDALQQAQSQGIINSSAGLEQAIRATQVVRHEGWGVE